MNSDKKYVDFEPKYIDNVSKDVAVFVVCSDVLVLTKV